MLQVQVQNNVLCVCRTPSLGNFIIGHGQDVWGCRGHHLQNGTLWECHGHLCQGLGLATQTDALLLSLGQDGGGHSGYHHQAVMGCHGHHSQGVRGCSGHHCQAIRGLGGHHCQAIRGRGGHHRQSVLVYSGHHHRAQDNTYVTDNAHVCLTVCFNCMF